jgi:hypothetical protein
MGCREVNSCSNNGRTSLGVIALSDDGSVPPGSTSPPHSRKNKATGAAGAGAVPDGGDHTRTAAHALFGPAAPRFEVMRILVNGEQAGSKSSCTARNHHHAHGCSCNGDSGFLVLWLGFILSSSSFLLRAAATAAVDAAGVGDVPAACHRSGNKLRLAAPCCHSCAFKKRQQQS